MERQISQALKMLASLPVDHKKNLICESAPFMNGGPLAHAVVKLPFWCEAPTFLDIRGQVHKT
jgi:hypothetical protein